MTTKQKLTVLDKTYTQKRQKLFRQLVKTWKYCNYQGCNECRQYGGLVPPTHEYAGCLGPKDFYHG